MRNRKLLTVVLLFAFALSACATMMDAKLTYLTTRDTFNAALKNYIERVRVMPDGAAKEDVKATFNPLWKDAETSLDAWGAALRGTSLADPAESVRAFSQAKNELIRLGLKYFGDRLFE